MSKAAKTAQTAEVNTNVATETPAPQVDMKALETKHDKVKSKMIRELAAGGMKTADITKAMKTLYPEFLYQHARNVLNQKTKKTA